MTSQLDRVIWRGEYMLNNVYEAEYWDLLMALPDASIDMVLADMPYGTTACKWDTVFDLASVWRQVKRVLKPKGAAVFTASQPFTTFLGASNIDWLRYSWAWVKTLPTGYLNANRNPLKSHEDILVFYDGLGVFNPQMEKGKPYATTSGRVGGYVRDKTVCGWLTKNEGYRFPKSAIHIASQNGIHPTQKPVALFEYLIRTYTNPGDVVLDFCVGSGTTALAARNTGRNFIVGDYDAHWVDVTKERLAEPYTLPLFEELPEEPKITQLELLP